MDLPRPQCTMSNWPIFYALSGFLVPLHQFVFIDRVHNPVKDAVQKIFADPKPLFPIRRWDNAVNDPAKVNILVYLLR